MRAPGGGLQLDALTKPCLAMKWYPSWVVHVLFAPEGAYWSLVGFVPRRRQRTERGRVLRQGQTRSQHWLTVDC